MAPSEFMSVLSDALSLRSSKATERNANSSRSHAICTITLVHDAADYTSSPSSPSSSPSSPALSKRSRLRLVDLAGSERNYETMGMAAADHRESAEINSTLMALKDCFRAYNYERSGKVLFVKTEYFNVC
jgi:hypothetical protein